MPQDSEVSGCSSMSSSLRVKVGDAKHHLELPNHPAYLDKQCVLGLHIDIPVNMLVVRTAIYDLPRGKELNIDAYKPC